MKILFFLLLNIVFLSCANRDVVNTVEDTEKEFRSTIKIKKGQEFIVIGYMDPEKPTKVKNIEFVDDKSKERFMKSLKANKGATVVKPDGQAYMITFDKKFDQRLLIYSEETQIENLDGPIAKEPIVIKSHSTKEFREKKKNKKNQ